MTIDKIKHYMTPHIFNYWTVTVMELQDRQYWLDRALSAITIDINSGALKGIEYHAEKYLLTMLGAKLRY